MILTLGSAILVLATGLFLLKQWIYSYWKRRGIYTINTPPNTPFPYIYGYNKLRELGLKYGGCFIYHDPTMIIADLDLIKSILIEHFDHFVNHSTYFNEKDDPLSATLEALEGEHWRRIRYLMSPAFSTGNFVSRF